MLSNSIVNHNIFNPPLSRTTLSGIVKGKIHIFTYIFVKILIYRPYRDNGTLISIADPRVGTWSDKSNPLL